MVFSIFRKKSTPEQLPAEVLKDLRMAGYRENAFFLYGATGSRNRNPDCCLELLSPEGRTVNSRNTPIEVQEKFERAVRLSYESHGLTPPKIIPGTEHACLMTKALKLLNS